MRYEYPTGCLSISLCGDHGPPGRPRTGLPVHTLTGALMHSVRNPLVQLYARPIGPLCGGLVSTAALCC